MMSRSTGGSSQSDASSLRQRIFSGQRPSSRQFPRFRANKKPDTKKLSTIKEQIHPFQPSHVADEKTPIMKITFLKFAGPKESRNVVGVRFTDNKIDMPLLMQYLAEEKIDMKKTNLIFTADTGAGSTPRAMKRGSQGRSSRVAQKDTDPKKNSAVIQDNTVPEMKEPNLYVIDKVVGENETKLNNTKKEESSYREMNLKQSDKPQESKDSEIKLTKKNHNKNMFRLCTCSNSSNNGDDVEFLLCTCGGTPIYNESDTDLHRRKSSSKGPGGREKSKSGVADECGCGVPDVSSEGKKSKGKSKTTKCVSDEKLQGVDENTRTKEKLTKCSGKNGESDPEVIEIYERKKVSKKRKRRSNLEPVVCPSKSARKPVEGDSGDSQRKSIQVVEHDDADKKEEPKKSEDDSSKEETKVNRRRSTRKKSHGNVWEKVSVYTEEDRKHKQKLNDYQQVYVTANGHTIQGRTSDDINNYVTKRSKKIKDLMKSSRRNPISEEAEIRCRPSNEIEQDMLKTRRKSYRYPEKEFEARVRERLQKDPFTRSEEHDINGHVLTVTPSAHKESNVKISSFLNKLNIFKNLWNKKEKFEVLCGCGTKLTSLQNTDAADDCSCGSTQVNGVTANTGAKRKTSAMLEDREDGVQRNTSDKSGRNIRGNSQAVLTDIPDKYCIGNSNEKLNEEQLRKILPVESDHQTKKWILKKSSHSLVPASASIHSARPIGGFNDNKNNSSFLTVNPSGADTRSVMNMTKMEDKINETSESGSVKFHPVNLQEDLTRIKRDLEKIIETGNGHLINSQGVINDETKNKIGKIPSIIHYLAQIGCDVSSSEQLNTHQGMVAKFKNKMSPKSPIRKNKLGNISSEHSITSSSAPLHNLSDVNLELLDRNYPNIFDYPNGYAEINAKLSDLERELELEEKILNKNCSRRKSEIFSNKKLMNIKYLDKQTSTPLYTSDEGDDEKKEKERLCILLAGLRNEVRQTHDGHVELVASVTSHLAKQSRDVDSIKALLLSCMKRLDKKTKKREDVVEKRRRKKKLAKRIKSDESVDVRDTGRRSDTIVHIASTESLERLLNRWGDRSLKKKKRRGKRSMQVGKVSGVNSLEYMKKRRTNKSDSEGSIKSPQRYGGENKRSIDSNSFPVKKRKKVKKIDNEDSIKNAKNFEKVKCTPTNPLMRTYSSDDVTSDVEEVGDSPIGSIVSRNSPKDKHDSSKEKITIDENDNIECFAPNEENSDSDDTHDSIISIMSPDNSLGNKSSSRITLYYVSEGESNHSSGSCQTIVEEDAASSKGSDNEESGESDGSGESLRKWKEWGEWEERKQWLGETTETLSEVARKLKKSE